MPFDLHFYLEQFPSVCENKFGRQYDLAGLERRLSDLRDNKHLLTAKDVARIFNSDATPFGKYWPRPHVKALEEALSRERIKLGILVANPPNLIQRLLAVFHNLGTASLVLQFVFADRFAIFSTPLIHILHVTRPNLVDLYLDYCKELGTWTERFRMPSVAATSTALWTFSQLTKETGHDDGQASLLRREFEEDLWIQRRIVSHVVSPFLKRYGPLRLAQILSEEDPRLAGKIVAEEYERLLNVASNRMYGRPMRDGKGAAGRAATQLLTDLAAGDIIDMSLVPELQLVWEMRNRVVHPDDRPITPEEIERMVDTVERVCVPWSKSNQRFKPKSGKLR